MQVLRSRAVSSKFVVPDFHNQQKRRSESRSKITILRQCMAWSSSERKTWFIAQNDSQFAVATAVGLPDNVRYWVSIDSAHL